jgi:fumarylacetoacetase
MCYNGRASSIVPSSTDIHRPRGVYFDTGESDGSSVSYAASKKLDFELEVGYLVSRPLPHGTTLAIKDAPDYIFGFVLLNDWSARDFQAFEMRPLGPFHSKGEYIQRVIDQRGLLSVIKALVPRFPRGLYLWIF